MIFSSSDFRFELELHGHTSCHSMACSVSSLLTRESRDSTFNQHSCKFSILGGFKVDVRAHKAEWVGSGTNYARKLYLDVKGVLIK